MKKITIISSAAACASVLMLTVFSSQAGPLKSSPEKLDEKIASAQARLEALQSKATKRIPEPVLANARGIVILRQLKVGLGFGAEAGGGVALVKETGTDNWGPPAFVGAAEGSWGLQIGAQDSDLVIVLMSEKSLNFLKPMGSTGAGFEAAATAGPVDVGQEFDSESLKSNVLVYSDSAGAFAGITLKAGGITGAKQKNMTYHGAAMQDILFAGKGKITPAGQALIDSIQLHAGKPSKLSANVKAE